MTYVYDKSGQGIYFQRESDTYGHIYDPADTGITAWTKIPAAYPHWRKLDYMVDEFDAILPIIEKLKIFDIGDSKHASAVVNGNIEPVEFSIDMEAQGLEFLMLAIGAPAFSSHGRKIIQNLAFGTAQPTQGDYFLFDCIDNDVVKHYAFWSDTVNDDTTGKPVIAGIATANVLSVDTSGPPADTEALADIIETMLEALDGVTTANNATATNSLDIVVANEGAVLPARDGAAAFDMTTTVTTMGSTVYTVAEALTTLIPSFTMHLQHVNTTAAENIVWDLFGCVIESVTVNVAFADKIVKCSVTIKCPYAVEGNTGTNLPPKKLIATMPTMSSLVESASNYLIQEGTTDRTPASLEKAELTITNNIKFQPNIAKQYMDKAIAGKRDVKLNIVGATQEKELFNYWQGAYTEGSGDYYPTGADKLNTVFKLVKDATYDYVSIAIYNWLLKEHNFTFVDVDGAVKVVDMTFEDGSANSAGRILTATTMASLIDRTVMVEDALA